MSWLAVARKDYADAVRSKWIWGFTGLLTLLVLLAAYLIGSASGVLGTLLGLVITPLVSLVALIASYNAIAGERESGSLKLLLSLPNSRRDVVLGKLAGRTAAVATPVVLGFLIPLLVFLVAPVTIDAVAYISFVVLTVVLAAAFVSIAIGASAGLSTRTRAMTLAILLYLLFVPLWAALKFPLRIYLLFNGGNFPVNPQFIYGLIGTVNPGGAYQHLATAALSHNYSGRWLPLSAAVLIAWIVIPPALGLLAFQRSDL